MCRNKSGHSGMWQTAEGDAEQRSEAHCKYTEAIPCREELAAVADSMRTPLILCFRGEKHLELKDTANANCKAHLPITAKDIENFR